MTTPIQTDTQDVPLAQVSTFGLSEITLLLTLVGSICTALFGKDFGISAHLQDIAGQAVIYLPIALGVFRAVKHHGVARANAIVLATRPAAPAGGSQLPSPATLTLPVVHPLDTVPATSDL